tara:strand:+ start:26 stop:904 length:879 start_codon:yes stop_codon:yes gene_type:complete
MEFLDKVLNNTNVKYFVIIILILFIATLNPPLNRMVNLIYNNILGKIILLSLIIYYSNPKIELGIQISILLTLLYILLLNVNNTENNITTYGKLINNNLIGGTVEEQEEEDLESSTEEDEEIEEEINNKEVVQEENIDKQIEKVIQEEIILNKDKYDENLKEARKLGAKQYKMNKKLSKAKKELETQTNNYKKSEEDFNKIMKEVGRFDTNKDGTINFEDEEPNEEELIEEELNMEEIEEEMNKNMKNIKSIGGDFDKLVSIEKIKGGNKKNGNMEIVYDIEGYDNNEYSNL